MDFDWSPVKGGSMPSNVRPSALAIVLAAATLCAACLGVSRSREEVLAMQLHFGKYGNEIQAAVDSGKLTADEERLLRGFQGRYSGEPFYRDKFPEGITVKGAIRDERKYIHDADPRPHGPFVENDNETR
jgi:hypothetical protein